MQWVRFLPVLNRRISPDAPGPTYPLDGMANIWSARSTRRLLTSYTGDVVLARRSSDSSTQGANATEYTDGTLDSFIGAGDGFVATHYDQSGNGYDWTQSTAADQPKIWESGAVLTKSGVNALRSPSTGWVQNSETTGLPSSASIIVAIQWELLSGFSESILLYDDPATGKFLGYALNGNNSDWHAGAGTPSLRINGVDKPGVLTRNNLFDDINVAGPVVLRFDSVDLSGWAGISSGQNGGGQPSPPWLFEEVILTSSTNAQEVESAMMDYVGL